ncbi:MAG: hypothetical protein VB141_11575 [Burkholderia gladioli]
MPDYRYTGPATGLSFADGREVLLFDGRTVNLPPCAEVDTLIALKRLARVDVTHAKPIRADDANKTGA